MTMLTKLKVKTCGQHDCPSVNSKKNQMQAYDIIITDSSHFNSQKGDDGAHNERTASIAVEIPAITLRWEFTMRRQNDESSVESHGLHSLWEQFEAAQWATTNPASNSPCRLWKEF